MIDLQSVKAVLLKAPGEQLLTSKYANERHFFNLSRLTVRLAILVVSRNSP